jgi:hypothetical protein
MKKNTTKKWIPINFGNFKEQDILFKNKNKQIEWLGKYGLKIGDIIKQDNYIHLEPFEIKWSKKYKCIIAVNNNWTAYHFFGDLFIPEKCKVFKR